jgi:hypothetical protein
MLSTHRQYMIDVLMSEVETFYFYCGSMVAGGLLDTT